MPSPDGDTYSDQLVFRSCGKKPSIRTKADTANVEIAVLINALVLEERDLLPGLHVKDLCRAIATGSDVFAISAEPHTAYNTLMHQMVDNINIEHSRDIRIEDCEPVLTLSLQIRTELVRLKI